MIGPLSFLFADLEDALLAIMSTSASLDLRTRTDDLGQEVLRPEMQLLQPKD